MTTSIMIIICTLILIAYIFDITSSRTRIPSVILLLGLGWIVRQLLFFFKIDLPDLQSLLPILGTTGLIMIVLEGSLELELNSKKGSVLKSSFLSSFLSIIIFCIVFTVAFNYAGGYDFHTAVINAIPLAVISSAIAIPSVKSISANQKEFVIYESSFSDILGVILFNFFLINTTIQFDSIISFSLEMGLIILISFVATALLSILLNKIDHHVKFIPIMLLVILVYSISKLFHLPGLVFVLVLGLFLGNLDEMHRFKWMHIFKTEELDKEVQKFKELVFEVTFLIRTLFFLLFGFLMETQEIINTKSLGWAIGITLFIFILRYVLLKSLKLPITPLLFIAPRGLITILLALSIPAVKKIPYINNALIIQVIILTAFIMMIGLMLTKYEALPGRSKTSLSKESSANDLESATQKS